MIWKLIGNVKSFLDKCKRDKINAYSAQSAFFIILSIIPFLMVFSSLLQYTSVTESMLLEIIRHLMPEYVNEQTKRSDLLQPLRQPDLHGERSREKFLPYYL